MKQKYSVFDQLACRWNEIKKEEPAEANGRRCIWKMFLWEDVLETYNVAALVVAPVELAFALDFS